MAFPRGPDGAGHTLSSGTCCDLRNATSWELVERSPPGHPLIPVALPAPCQWLKCKPAYLEVGGACHWRSRMEGQGAGPLLTIAFWTVKPGPVHVRAHGEDSCRACDPCPPGPRRPEARAGGRGPQQGLPRPPPAGEHTASVLCRHRGR